VGSWLAARENRPSFLLLLYEDLTRQTETELQKVAHFLGLNADAARLRQVVERSSAERMRDLERTQASEWVTTKNKRDDIPFVGAAAVGRWKTKLSAGAVAEIESAWGRLMAHLDYQLMHRHPSEQVQGGPALSQDDELLPVQSRGSAS
jgi:hypothetical protein